MSKVRDPYDSFPRKLETRPWGDGSSLEGMTNIVAEEWSIVIASDVEKTIAKEICRLWNERNE